MVMDDIATTGDQAGQGISDALGQQAGAGEGSTAQEPSAKEQALEKQLGEAKRKADILDQMLDDERFQEWLNTTADDDTPGGNRGVDTGTPNIPSPPVQAPGTEDINATFLALRDKDPELAESLGKIFQAQQAQIAQAVGPKIQELESGLRQSNLNAEIQRSTHEINTMRANKEDFPMFEQVWTDMAEALKAKRVTNLKDAYTLAVSSKIPMNRIAQKQAATMLHGKQGEMNTSIKDKIYKSPREAAEAALAGMGWTPEGDF